LSYGFIVFPNAGVTLCNFCWWNTQLSHCSTIKESFCELINQDCRFVEEPRICCSIFHLSKLELVLFDCCQSITRLSSILNHMTNFNLHQLEPPTQNDCKLWWVVFYLWILKNSPFQEI
jgi:hypothetical protein